ncbi:MAG: hypothetical protein ACE5Q5_01330 [Nitrosarchaeum sp.]
MTDPLIDDVKALLTKEKGDERILKQIYRACENNEVISNYERNYVRTLAEKYLGRLPPSEEQPVETKPDIPDVVFLKTPPKKNIESFSSKQSRGIKSKLKNPKILLAGSSLIVILIVFGIYSTGGFYVESDDSQITPVDTPPTSLSIKTDLSTYQKGDIISISGTSNTSGKINILIENQNGQLVWSEQLSVKSNGKFSTLAIAGGSGWDKSGTFTIKVDNNSEVKSKTFTFKA